MGLSKHTGGIQMYWGIWTPPQSEKACFLFVVYAGIQTSSKHTQGHPNIWECPNIQGHPNIGVPKLTGDIQT